MAPSAEPVMEQTNHHVLINDSAKDWVSLLLSEPVLDLEADYQVHPHFSLADFESLPHYDPCRTDNSPSANFDISDIVQNLDTFFCINPSTSHPSDPQIRNFEDFPPLQNPTIPITSSSSQSSTQQTQGLTSQQSPTIFPCPILPNPHNSESDLTQGSNEPYFSLEELDLSIKVDKTNTSESNEGSMFGSASSGQQSDSQESGLQFQVSENFTELTSEKFREGQAESQLQFGSENQSKVVELSRSRKALGRKSGSYSPEKKMGDSSKTRENGDGDAEEENEQRKLARLMRNRESAQLSRQRKKAYIDELEERIKTMASTISELNNTISLISAENINLRRQLGFYNQPPTSSKLVGVPMGVPWVPYPPVSIGGRYMGAGSQVPLVPIPRLKSQPIPAKRGKKSKLEGQQDSREKAPKKAKKVAGIAIMGFFFVTALLFPFNISFLGLKMNVRNDGGFLPGGWSSHSERIVLRGGGRVLTSWDVEDSSMNVTSSVEESQAMWIGISDHKPNLEAESHPESSSEIKEKRLGNFHPITKCVGEDKSDEVQSTMGVTRSDSPHTTTTQLAATLFVPRNGDLVKIDGNLIIHSLLAVDRGRKELNKPQTRNEEFRRNGLDKRVMDGKGLALASNLRTEGPKVGKEEFLQVQESGVRVELQRALTAGAASHSEKVEGSLQEWFVQGLAGPVLSSGMCQEVFQFETSASTSSVSSDLGNEKFTSMKESKDYKSHDQDEYPGKAQSGAGHHVQFRRGRNTYAVPLPPVKEQAPLEDRKSRQNETDFKHTTHSIREGKPSFAVSVLASPPEFGDEAGLPGGSTGISRFFVVILIDSVKYVTYSCMLPSKGTQSQFVTN